MGIRVHKFAGYGLTDLNPDDERVNWDSPLLTETVPAGDYYRWLKDRPPLGHSMDLLIPRTGDLRGCVAWQAEFGLPNVLALRPAACTDWHRYDDIIDYLTESYPRDGSEWQGNWVQVLPDGIDPFNGLFMDAATGQDLPLNVIRWVQVRNDIRPGADPHLVEQTLDLVAARYTPYASHAEATARIVPRAPREVRDLAEFGHLFTGPEAWLQLRPLLYTWWS